MKKLAYFMVAIGAISYGVPATLFKLADKMGIENGVLLFWAFFISFIILTGIQIIFGKPLLQQTTNWRLIMKIILAGTASGFTNTFYILALRTIPVAVAAVMLMQSVWLSILFESLIKRRWPSIIQFISIIIILLGTVLAANLFPLTSSIDWIGFGFSFLAAVSYAVTLQATGTLGNQLQSLTKTWLLSMGALCVIILVWGPQLLSAPITLTVIEWGGVTALFSLLIPLICFSIFMPKLPLGAGPILSSLELPSAITVAWLILHESINFTQMIGILLIIATVIVSNSLTTHSNVSNESI